jgi:hypothetical protein
MRFVTTTDLSEFGYIEKMKVKDLLIAWCEHGLPEDFYNDKVVPMFNKDSGHVFLTNEDFQVAMLDESKLVSFYSCPDCGDEGFREELMNGQDCCKEYLKGME